MKSNRSLSSIQLGPYFTLLLIVASILNCAKTEEPSNISKAQLPMDPASETRTEPVVLNDNGAWCWFQDERAILVDGKLIVGSVANAAGAGGQSRDGNIEVVSYDIESGDEPILHVLDENLEGDDHDLPALLELPDNKVLAAYSTHSADNFIRYRTGTMADSRLTWGPLDMVERPARVTYSNLFNLKYENDGKGRIYNFYRGENWNPNIIYSDNLWGDWHHAGRLIDFEGRPYVKYASNNTDTVHFITSENHPRNHDNSLYHGYLKDGAVYRSDGSFVRRVEDGPVRPNELTLVFEGNPDRVAWISDIHLDKEGNPFIGFSVQFDDADKPDLEDQGQDIRYFYGRLNGKTWNVHQMAYAGTGLYEAENDYSGLIALDPQNPSTVYISTNSHPETGQPLISREDKKRHYEIFKGSKVDDSESWTWQFVTLDSTEDNLRPIVPINNGQTRNMLLWMRGSYETYTNYDLEIVGVLMGDTSQLTNDIHESFQFATRQYLEFAEIAAEHINERNFLPRSRNKDGSLRLTHIEDWTSGFFPGSLWYLYEYNLNYGRQDFAQRLLSYARLFTHKLEPLKNFTGHHDVGFMMYCSYGNGLRLTDHPDYSAILNQAAGSLATRYSDNVKSIKSWDWWKPASAFPVIIDNMMNLELLYWAADDSNNPRFEEIAINHANATMNNHFREDASTYHVVTYNPNNGQKIAGQTFQGFADDSTWARGQGWAIYGFTTSYRETNDERYLEKALAAANFVLDHENYPEDGTPYWDFNDPRIPQINRDASAGTIYASAFYELSAFVGGADSLKLKRAADKILGSLSSIAYRETVIGGNHGFVLKHTVGALDEDLTFEVDFPLNYADYYYFEAMLRRLGSEG